ncbi:MAG: 8-amino-7-oxononanoate synthase [Oceanospirillales bacterium]|nr:MAG: 8-amino-7-oxononanoate synthase [Oceanospirillales bacterium]
MNLDHYLQQRLQEREGAGLTRERWICDSPQSATRLMGERSYFNFSSNDYLGLADDPRVKEAMLLAVNKHGVGSGASHLTAGHHRTHHQLEQALAEFTGRERVLLFSSGYMANVGVICALMEKGDTIFHDRLNHASLLDAGQLSGATSRRFAHLDYDVLKRWLQKNQSAKSLVVTDGVFSMDGDKADLVQLSRLCQTHHAWLMVDDAHGFGVLGETGGGCAQVDGLGQQDLPILIGTLGKAFGTSGAFVAGSASLIEALIQFSRTYIYTTAMPPAVAEATLTSLELIQKETWRRSHLSALIDQFRQGCKAKGISLMNSNTPIQPVLVGDTKKACEISALLKASGCWVTAIRPPTVPQGTARLRVTLTAQHSAKQIDYLIHALEKAFDMTASLHPESSGAEA